MATFVLIHGAYQGGWIWSPVATQLRDAGHRVYAPSLDGCAERSAQARPGITTETQAEEIAELLRYEDLTEVVLVGTSSGGMVLAKVAELARERIQRLVFADALALLDGETIRDIVTSSAAITDDVVTGPAPGGMIEALQASMEPEMAAWAAERFGLHPVAAFNQAGRPRIVLGSIVGRLRDLLPTGAESRQAAPAPLRRGARRALARARHRALPNAEHTRRADAPDSRGLVVPAIGRPGVPPINPSASRCNGGSTAEFMVGTC